MSVSPRMFADSAVVLSKGEYEIDWRNSISRSYYAAYHLATESSTLCPPTDNLETGKHEQLARRFQLSKSSDGKVIAQALFLMKRQRVIADYKIELKTTHLDAQDQVEKYHQFTRRMISFCNTTKPVLG